MADPAFTVVMPAFDTAATVGAAIASALDQTRRDFELLVVDDGSTDGTPEVVRGFTGDPRVRLLTQEHAGAGAARNAAIAQSTGRYVSMLDSDDLWLPTHLETAGEALARHPDAGLVYTNAWILDEQPLRVRRRLALADDAEEGAWLGGEELLLRLVEANFIINSTVTVPRSVLVEVGGCNTALGAAIDYDLWVRIAAVGYGAVRAPGCHAVYRMRIGSIQQGRSSERRAYHGLREVYRLIAEEYAVGGRARAIARSRMTELDREIDVVEGRRRVQAGLRRLRPIAGRAKRALLARRIWYVAPPPELARLLRGPENARGRS